MSDLGAVILSRLQFQQENEVYGRERQKLIDQARELEARPRPKAKEQK